MSFLISLLVVAAFIAWIVYEVKHAPVVNDDGEFEAFHREAVDFRSREDDE